MIAQNKINSGKEVVQNIQLLRGFSALLVIFFHLDRLLSLLGSPPFGSGGVDIFFVISGFIMVYTTTNRDVSPRSFIAERVARIVPPYWAITLAVFAVAVMTPSLLQATRANWTELFKSLSFIPFTKSNGLVEPLLFVGWSLNYEMFFYIIFAVGLGFRARRMGAFSVIACLALLVSAGLALRPHGVVARFYTSPVMLDFVLGMMIGLSYQRLPARAGVPLKAATASLVFLSAGAIILLPLAAPHISKFVLCGLPAGLVVSGALQLERWGWAVRSRLPLRLGAASYSIYLVHPFVTQLAQKLTARLDPTRLAALFILIATLVAASVVGILVHQLVERPLSRAARRLLKTHRLNPRAT